MKNFKKYIIPILLAIVVIIFSPFIYFCLTYFVGLLIKFTFGATFVKGLSLLGITITETNIPLFCGVVGTIAGFFKNPVTKTKE